MFEERDELIGRRGLAIIRVRAEKPHLIKASARDMWMEGDELVLQHPNSYTRSGLRNAALAEFGLSTAANGTTIVGPKTVGFIGIDSDTSAVTIDTRFLHGSAAGTSTATTIIKAFSPVAAINTDGAGVTPIVTGGASFTQADFTNGVFKISKLGLLTGNTDADGYLVDVIGGNGGASPYNRTFALDLTGSGSTFSFTVQIAVNLIAI